jgi:hypothetical protein
MKSALAVRLLLDSAWGWPCVHDGVLRGLAQGESMD